ncbi:hypothetical protein [Glutamicibacter ardleyensis]|uniref:hypothetical protein n=1 Tax=Glutamicibacter ardleyensis TaxID=225894 RepID=UPI003FD05FB9
MILSPALQPYPEREPWFDLNEYVINGWQSFKASTSAFHMLAKIDGNEIRLQLHTRNGTARQITAALPDELLPLRAQTLPAFQRNVGSVVIEILADGTIHLPEYAGGIANGTSLNLVCQASYLRKVT